MSWFSSVKSARLEDGREVHAVQLDRLAPWSVWIGDDRSSARSGRWLLSLLVHVLGTPQGKAPDWVFALVAEFSGFETPAGRRFPCPCCDQLTIDKPVSSRTCPVCGWEDCLVQLEDPDLGGGANRTSLREARASYRARGHAQDRSAGRVRSPFDYERPPE